MKESFKLLIGYDGSTCSDAALIDLKRAGLPERVEAVVVSVAHVFAPPEGEMAENELVSPGAAAMVAPYQVKASEVVKQALAVAKQGADHIKSNFPTWEVRADAQGDSPAWALIKMAARLRTNLIVVGSHDHSSAGGRLIMGSVSLRVLHEAGCSVRVARCSDHRREGPVRIVVGFDGSKESDAAIDAVASRSWREGSEVFVITAREASVPEERRIRLEKLRAAGLTPSEINRDGEPAHVLIEEARKCGADSVFLGTRDLHGLRHLLQGSVSAAVAAHAPCSVEVVRAVKGATLEC